MTIRPSILLLIITGCIFVQATACSTCMVTDKELATAPVSFTKPHEYFDYLSSLPEAIKSVGLRTMHEIDANMAARQKKTGLGIRFMTRGLMRFDFQSPVAKAVSRSATRFGFLSPKRVAAACC